MTSMQLGKGRKCGRTFKVHRCMIDSGLDKSCILHKFVSLFELIALGRGRRNNLKSARPICARHFSAQHIFAKTYHAQRRDLYF